MKQRCYNPKASKYHLYGGKGITVCEEWLNDFAKFHGWAIANGYSDKLTIDRKDSNIGYSPENCRWATYTEQSSHTTQNRVISYKGRTMILSEWAKELGMVHRTLHARIFDYGWGIEKALTTKVGKRTRRSA